MGCCDGKPQATRDVVRDQYGKIATQGGSCCGPNPCCTKDLTPEQVATSVGYAPDELALLPEGANMGLSCGNPTAIASLQPGEVVVDLGSGGGFDVFLAARKVGAEGKAIGVDMTHEMLAKARKNADAFRAETGLDNVEFRLGEIEHLPLADNSADCVISNCVINLSTEKEQVWREIARVLKPGGRVAVSDIALFKDLPEAARASVASLTGCLAGAVLIEETERMAAESGLARIDVRTDPAYVEKMIAAKTPLYEEVQGHLPEGEDVAGYVTSAYVSAWKPGSCGCGSCCG